LTSVQESFDSEIAFKEDICDAVATNLHRLKASMMDDGNGKPCYLCVTVRAICVSRYVLSLSRYVLSLCHGMFAVLILHHGTCDLFGTVRAISYVLCHGTCYLYVTVRAISVSRYVCSANSASRYVRSLWHGTCYLVRTVSRHVLSLCHCTFAVLSLCHGTFAVLQLLRVLSGVHCHADGEHL
jgi:hypothetical protein